VQAEPGSGVSVEPVPDKNKEAAIVTIEKIDEGITGKTEQTRPWAFIIGGISAFFMLIVGFFVGRKKSKKKTA
jgi:hypothetical protein